ncbi:sensor histidine kinase [Vibrio tritonius]|uniref:histidine kinase n=1 Tax=Vibrio tritonius TaxID=1435069 RepID=A0ABS7YQV1_9VIBR|nr:sensor histidine kinase [Vibrio tritonius]MCA2018061.1 sensor histidine kinase [Vibrio tritonius]
MKLKSHLAISTIATSSTIVIVVTTVIFFLLKNLYQEGLQNRGIELAKVLAQDSRVVEATRLSNLGQSPHLNDYIEHIRSQTSASYIVVVNHNAIRLSHSNPQRVGHHFVGDDIQRALTKGEAYSTVAKGSLGDAIRNFVPIIDNGQTIGAICIGYLSERASAILLEQYGHIGVMIAVVYLLAISMVTLFVYKMKRTFLDYEPEYIVNKFSEHELILNSIRDAIIAVDTNLNITTINNSAMKLFAINNYGRHDYVNQGIARYSLSLSHLVISTQQRFHQGEFTVGKFSFRANIYPLQSPNGQIGHVIVFFPNLNQSQLERELVYLKNYSELLRSKTHEYSNKLNTLSGMLQLGRNNEAIRFIQQETDQYQSVINAIVRNVSNSAVAGLLLAKFNKANEMGVEYTLDPDSMLSNYGKTVSDKLVTIIGNLVDNALLAAWQNRNEREPKVYIYLSDRSRHLIIEVQDTGSGIDDAIFDHILEFGVSSKQDDEQHGIGLYLVGQLVDYFEGTIDWERTENDTTLFSLYLDKKNIEQYD